MTSRNGGIAQQQSDDVSRSHPTRSSPGKYLCNHSELKSALDSLNHLSACVSACTPISILDHSSLSEGGERTALHTYLRSCPIRACRPRESMSSFSLSRQSRLFSLSLSILNLLLWMLTSLVPLWHGQG